MKNERTYIRVMSLLLAIVMILGVIPVQIFAAVEKPNWNEKKEDLPGKRNIWELESGQKVYSERGANSNYLMLEMEFVDYTDTFAHFKARVSGNPGFQYGNFVLRADESLRDNVNMRESYFRREGDTTLFFLTQDNNDDALVGRGNFATIFGNNYSWNRPAKADFYLNLNTKPKSGNYIIQSRIYKGNPGSETFYQYSALTQQHSVLDKQNPYYRYTQTYPMVISDKSDDMTLGVKKEDIPWTIGIPQMSGITSYFQLDNKRNKLRVYYNYRGTQGGPSDDFSKINFPKDGKNHNYNIGFRIAFPNEFYDVLSQDDGTARVNGKEFNINYVGRYTQIGQAGHKFVDGSYATNLTNEEYALRGLVGLKSADVFTGGSGGSGNSTGYPERDFNQRILTTNKLTRGNHGEFTSIDIVGPQFSEKYSNNNWYKANYDGRHIRAVSAFSAPISNVFEFNIDPIKFRETFFDENGNYNGKLVFRNSFIFNDKGTDNIVELEDSASYAAGAGESTQYNAKVDEIFTNGGTDFSGHIMYPDSNVYYSFRDTLDKLFRGVGSTNSISEKVSVDGTEHNAYRFYIPRPNVELKKDMGISFAAAEFGKLPSEIVTEQVQAKVSFYPGGPLGNLVKYDKIAPLNKEYVKIYDKESGKFIKNKEYVASGFGEIKTHLRGEAALKDDEIQVVGSFDNLKVENEPFITINGEIGVDGETLINYTNHNGEAYDINNPNPAVASRELDALRARQWPIVMKNGNKFINGKILIGWTTKKLEDIPDGKTAEEQYYDLQKNNKIVTDISDWEQARSEAYVYTSSSPLEKDETVYGVWATPTIKLHTNFGTDFIHTQHFTAPQLNKLVETNNPREIYITLDEVFNTNEFKRPGYNLVGFSRNPNADQPDYNVTGEGLTKDFYLRDGDTTPLAVKKSEKPDGLEGTYQYIFDTTKGLDLYAVWKPDFTITASKTWLDAQGNNLQADRENANKLKIALITRPAVGSFGNEVVTSEATYYPVQGSIKNYTGEELTWNNVRGYDEKGRRMSYLLVELVNERQVNAFKNGSTNLADYGVLIINPEYDEKGHVIKHGDKEQFVDFNSTDPNAIDAFTAATVRRHKTDENINHGIDPHGEGVEKIGYFATRGYDFDLNNKESSVLPPSIEQGYTEDKKIVIVPPTQMVDKITITLPNGDTAVFKKNSSEDGYVGTNEGTATGAELSVNPEGVLEVTLPNGESLVKGDLVKAYSTNIVAGINQDSEEVSMRVVDRMPSTKPDRPLQGWKENGNVPISFVVRDPITNRPAPGTVYEIIKLRDGQEKSLGNIEITLDNADTFPGTTQTVYVPENNLSHGDTIIIRAKEPNKKVVDSDELIIDLKGPAVIKSSAQDERWRRWSDISAIFDEEVKGPVTLTYMQKNEKIEETYQSIEETNVEFEKLQLDDSVSTLSIKAFDKFGNESDKGIEYEHIGKTSLIIKEPLAGKNFVWITPKDEDMTVTINVYAKGTDLDSYPRDKYFDFSDEDNKPEPYETQVIQFTNTKRTKVRMPDGFKFEEGQVVDIVGTTGTKGDNYKISNPYTHVVK